MNVTTFTAQANPERRRVSIPLIGGLFGLIKKLFSKPKRLVFVIVAALAAVGFYSIFFSRDTVNEAPNVIPLSQTFEVVAKTKEGKITNGNIAFEVTGTYRAGSLLVQGQRVNARNGKDFLILNMELSNPYNVPLYIQPVDGFRLIDNDGKKFAPTAHQGNVEIRPQSTKNSNVGFVVDKGTQKFKVEVGELNSEKLILEFSL